jgi:hypothetical protein
VGYETFIDGDDDNDDDNYADLISGDEDDDLLESLSVQGYSAPEIMGAVKILRAAKKGNRGRKLVNAVIERNAGMVINRPVNRRRRSPSGFARVVVSGPGGTAQVPSAPQNLFRIERLVVPSDIGFDFSLLDIKVGNVSQLVQSLEVPAAMFSEVAIDTNVYFDTAQVGNQISLSVLNKTGGDIEFTAGMLGSVAK